MNQSDEYTLLGDVPALDPVSDNLARPDLLNFQSTAAVLARAAVQTRDPLTIGIFGEWGTGKTSMMNLMKQAMDKDPYAIPVWFNAWQYEKEEHLIVPLIATIDRALDEYEKSHLDLKAQLKKIIKELHDSLRGIIAGMTIDLSVVKLSAKEAIAKADELRKGTKKDSFYFEAFDQLKNCAKDMGAHKLRIVVFIDDMDRCFPDNAVKLLEGIKLVLHQPGFSFVLGVNENIIQAFIRTKYEKECNVPGRKFDDSLFGDYLDKMVQVKIPVPKRETDGMREYIGTLLEKSGILIGETGEAKDIKNDLISLTAQACNNNPRKVVRMLNRIMVTNWISNEDNKDKPDSPKVDPLAATIHILTEEYADFREALDAWITLESGEKKEQKMIGEYLAELIKGYEQAAGRLKERSSPEKLGGRRDLLETAIEVLENKPFLCKVLQTPAGEKWLKEKQYRAQLGMAAQATEVKEQAPVRREQHIDRKDPISVLLSSMVKIPAGEFMMGSGKKDAEAYESEFPAHKVTLQAFELCAMPVTQAQYEAVMGKNPSDFQGTENGNHPVENVSWEDARVFCQKLSEKTHRIFTLPTEAQWEYACRAGGTGRYCFGDDEAKLKEYAWYNENSGGQTHPVGILKPNAWGVYDMHGNVWEWCEDSWHKNYDGAPNDGSAWVSEEGSIRVIRGGSWGNNEKICRSAIRNPNTPEYRINYFGFRVLAVPSPGPEGT